MKKEEVVSTGVMTVVCTLVLIGFTVAWLTLDAGRATVLGMQLLAADTANIKITLESAADNSDAEDVADLAEEGIYADIGLEELTNIEEGKLAPGAFGEVTFYVTPTEAGIQYCDIVPEVWIRQNGGWYPGTENTVWTDEEEAALEELYEITGRHLVFFTEEQMTGESILDESNPLRLTWTEEESDALEEKKAVIYWKWYYEYPFTDEETEVLTEEEQIQKIDEYDAEDTVMGNNITAMKYHFTFSAN